MFKWIHKRRDESCPKKQRIQAFLPPNIMLFPKIGGKKFVDEGGVGWFHKLFRYLSKMTICCPQGRATLRQYSLISHQSYLKLASQVVQKLLKVVLILSLWYQYDDFWDYTAKLKVIYSILKVCGTTKVGIELLWQLKTWINDLMASIPSNFRNTIRNGGSAVQYF